MQHNSFIGLYENAERLQRTSIVDFELNLINKHARYARHYTGLRFQGDAAIYRYFCQETLMAVVAML